MCFILFLHFLGLIFIGYRYVAYTSNYADMIYSGGMAAKKKAAENVTLKHIKNRKKHVY